MTTIRIVIPGGMNTGRIALTVGQHGCLTNKWCHFLLHLHRHRIFQFDFLSSQLLIVYRFVFYFYQNRYITDLLSQHALVMVYLVAISALKIGEIDIGIFVASKRAHYMEAV